MQVIGWLSDIQFVVDLYERASTNGWLALFRDYGWLFGVTWLGYLMLRPESKSESEVASAINEMRPIRILERYHLVLASMREHANGLKRLSDAGGTLHVTAFIDLGLALEKVRKELIDLSPRVFTTSEAMDFRETRSSDPSAASLSDERVPKEIDHLMETVLRHWERHGEKAGITPLRFRESPIVKLQDA